jgi:hypothetical protein
MIRKFRNIASLLFLLVFLLPTIIKLEHHQKHLLCDIKNEKQNYVFRDICPICNFEFSVFLSGAENIFLQKENHLDNYLNNYNSRYNSDLFLFSFLLRAPPDRVS